MTIVFDMDIFDAMISMQEDMTFLNSPITSLQMSIDLNHMEKSAAGTNTVNGTYLTPGDLDFIESLFFKGAQAGFRLRPRVVAWA